MDDLKDFLDAVLDWLEKKSLPMREACQWNEAGATNTCLTF